MNRFVKAVVLTAVTGAAVLGTAGGALAHDHDRSEGRHGRHHGGASARAVAIGSPGVLSGNVIQVPISIPINVCGNTVNVVGLLNPAHGNVCINN
ncbi:MAG: hypothetical protein QOF84_5143 [Streptomyces sp.]|jgi:hypothetical protein|nr:hypothetical protein [Streptomyces sp.]MDX6350353.1 hypothetical protein [Streptomyces sp.]